MQNRPVKLCKILATLGPASDAPERMQSLVRTGVDAFRLNFSHGSHEEHAERVKNIREAEKILGKPIPIVADLQGPKIRVGTLKTGEINLRYGDTYKLVCAKTTDDPNVIPVPHQELFDALQPGDTMMLDDGLLRLTMTANDGKEGEAKVDVPGKLTDKKGINIPGRKLPIAALTEKDREDLAFVMTQDVDYIALSFVQQAEDVLEARALIKEAGGNVGIISKIEKPAALEEIEGIIEASDAVMVARGDLGVELPLEDVPIVQRRLIHLSRRAGKPVIVATQMLQSMVDNPTPTRAEASDIASAVYLGADAVMLSAESAVGRHPESAVAIMTRIIRAVENDKTYWQELHLRIGDPEATSAAAISVSTHQAAELMGSKMIFACTSSGSTAFAIARERPNARIFGLTSTQQAARRITLAWGITAVNIKAFDNFEDLTTRAEEIAKEVAGAKAGDVAILTAGIPMRISGGTNTMKVITIQ